MLTSVVSEKNVILGGKMLKGSESIFIKKILKFQHLKRYPNIVYINIKI